MSKKTEKKTGRIVSAVATCGILVALGAWYALGDKTSEVAQNEIYTPVKSGPLVINILEAGAISASEQLVLKSEVEGRVAILSLVPEGTRVKKGDVLIQLDTAALSEKRDAEDIYTQNAEAAYINAKESLEVVKNKSLSDDELAETNYRFAEEDLVKYRDGEYPNKLNETIANVTLAQEELERARDQYEWSKKLYEEDYLSETELKSDELSWKRKELSLKTAKGNLNLLENFTYKREIAQLESDVKQRKMALERTLRNSKSSIIQAQATLRWRELEYLRKKERLAQLEKQLEKATIRAPMNGLVIYATSVHKWRHQQPLAEGTEVHQRQDLIFLPTADTFVAEVDVHESNLKKVYPGLPVRVRVDALPGKIFTGTVASISPLPDNQRMWANPDLKVYKTRIAINGGEGLFKSGMNCQAEIIVDQYDEALYLPLQCVVRVKKQPSVWVKTEAGNEIRPVEIGLDNNRFVRIISGLEAGDEVLLTPPLEGSVSGKATEVLDVEIPDRPVDAASVGATTNGVPESIQLDQPQETAKRPRKGKGAPSKADELETAEPVATESETVQVASAVAE